MLKRNLIANYLGQGWSGLIGLAFVPLYIKYLGIEAYGLIGIFALMQAWLMLLDMGLSPTLGREMARFLAGSHTPQSIRDLVRSAEWVFGLIAIAIGLGVMLAASWLATEWLRVEKLSTSTVTNSLIIIGWVIAARWLGGLYRSAINGLQEQVWLNVSNVIFSTLRALGVMAILIWVSPTILAFFIYQGVVFALEAVVLAIQVRRLLPSSPRPARFRFGALHQVWRFAAGMTAITILATLLTQMDKLLLSKLLSLTDFGYYILASTVASALYLLIMPISNVLRPHLAELVARGDTAALAETYHKFSQMLTLLVVPVALVLSFFSDHVLLLWTRSITTTDAVAPLVSLLVIGTMINGLMNTPYALQLAYGQTRFAIWANAISVLVLAPAIYVGVSNYGAIAAAVIWVLLNLGYVTIALPVMHRSLLPNEKWRWYGQDVLAPTMSSVGVVVFVYVCTPAPQLVHPWTSAGVLMLAFIAAVGAATVVTFHGRDQFRKLWRSLAWQSS